MTARMRAADSRTTIFISDTMSFSFTYPHRGHIIKSMLPTQPEDYIDDFDLEASIEALPLVKQQFMREYLVDMNASAAARRCGYSAKSCRVTACLMFKDPLLIKIRTEYTKMVMAQHDISVHRTLDELGKIAVTNIDEVCRWENNRLVVNNMDDIPPEMRAAVKKVSRVTTPLGTRLEIEMHDKIKALELIGRYHAMFTDKVKGEMDMKMGGVLRVPMPESEEEWENANNKG
jgi:phage terminase small subunit